MFLEEQETIPWAALEYVVGQINYGGPRHDDNDRRCLMSILRQYVTPNVLDESYKFTKSGTYYAPPEGPLESYREYLRSLPISEAPEVFGLHPNANISFQQQESQKLVETVLGIQPRIGSAGGGKSNDEIVGEMAAALEGEVPALFDIETEAALGLFDRTDTGQLNSLSVVLGQEIDRFNKLTRMLQTSLSELQKAIKGQVVMTLKPLASWVKDYHERIAFMRSWLQDGVPKCFWLPGFFFPQGFMTGCLQMHARKYSIPIDTLSFGFSVTEHEGVDSLQHGPEDGIFVNGCTWIARAGTETTGAGRERARAHVRPLPIIFKPRRVRLRRPARSTRALSTRQA
eukprot:jgi/Tetstr1/465508/TSEL_010177.t1